jgi:cytidylate kinase
MTVIAVDGPAASGKGTLARRLAAHYGLRHLDTGLVYRAVGLKVLRQGLDPVAAAGAVTLADLDRLELRGEEVGEAASKVAAMPEVRTALRALQRRFAEAPPGAVLDGRDIGTVVFPDARAKIFVDASPQVRAGRRHKELLERGVASIYSRVLQDMKDRDARDRDRAVAPLTPAKDAFVIDSSKLDADGVFALAVAHIGRVLPDLARG